MKVFEDFLGFGGTPLTVTPVDSINDILVTLIDSDVLLTPPHYDVTPRQSADADDPECF